MKSIYVVSTRKRAMKNKYKVGKHAGNQRKLLGRYGTPLIKPIIYYFKHVDDYTIIETLVLQNLDSFRIKNDNGIKTEWIRLPLKEIILEIENVVEQYTRNFIINIKNDSSSSDSTSSGSIENTIENTKNNQISIKNNKVDIIDPDFKDIDFTGPPYMCPRCRYATNKISTFKSHLKRKEKCIEIIYDLVCDCLEEFNNPNEYARHRKMCLFLKKKKILDKKKNIINNNN